MIRRLPLPRPLLRLFPLLLVLLAACTPGNPMSTFDSAGPVSNNQERLFVIIFIMAVVVFVAVEGALIYALIRYRRRPRQGVPAQVHGNRKLEIAWTIAPAVVLIGVAIPTIDVILKVEDTPDECQRTHTSEECIMVNVVGHQWWWEFEYPESNLVTANELHIRAGTPINLSLDSADVIHSFWVPKLAGKTDVVPGDDNVAWIRADEAGTFFGQCAEFCGLSHARMRFRVIAHPTADIPCRAGEHEPCPEEDFESWVAAQQLEAVAPVAETPQADGQQVFQAKLCVICRTIRGMPGAAGTIGPDLTHFASRDTLAAGVLENDFPNVEEWLRDPEGLKPGNVMSRDGPPYTDPAFALSPADISELVTYLLSLK